jgi:hypothetical protein
MLSNLTNDGMQLDEDSNDDESEDNNDGDDVSGVVESTTGNLNINGEEDNDSILMGLSGLSPPVESHERTSRSRSQSPLTVQSVATASVGPQSVASASVGTSILSTVAVAPARSFRARREAAARSWGLGGDASSSRSLANRVVTFTNDESFFTPPPEITEAGGDSITMPDELDNLSDIADVFADRARVWREEYEARLDAIQKRWNAE